MSTLKSIYVLYADNGEYWPEDYCSWVHGIYRGKVSAVEAAVKLCKETIGALPEGFLQIWDGHSVSVNAYARDHGQDIGDIWIHEMPLQGDVDGE